MFLRGRDSCLCQEEIICPVAGPVAVPTSLLPYITAAVLIHARLCRGSAHGRRSGVLCGAGVVPAAW